MENLFPAIFRMCHAPDFLRVTLLGGAGFHKGRGMGLHLSHGLTIIDFLAASWTVVKLQSWYGVALAMRLASPFLANLLYLVAPTGRTFGDREHRLIRRMPNGPWAQE